jgi:hypothetical protein
MSNYTFKRVSENEYADLVYLFEDAFKQSIDIDYYRHKNATDYLGVKHLGYAAYAEDGSPAAFYGVYPYMMEYKGKKVLAAQSGDTMTHSKHTGKGLFTTLAKMTYELAKKEGIQFIFGFPNENSYPGFVKKLSWINKENMNNYLFRVSTLPLSGAAKKFPFLMPLYKWYAVMVLSSKKSGAAFFNNSIGSDFGTVEHSPAFFKYKMFYDNHLVKLSDRSAWIKIDGTLLIGDIEIKESNNAAQVLSDVKRLAFWLGCSKIIFSVGKQTYWDKQFAAIQQPYDAVYIGYLDLQSNLPLEDFKYVQADFDTF